MTPPPSTPARRILTELLLVWMPAGAAGWLLYRVLGDAGTGTWLACLAGAVGLGTLGSVAVRARQPREDRLVAWAVFVGVGWAVANATGWSVGVEVGGPAFGIAVGLGVAGVTGSGTRIERAALSGGLGLVAMVAVRLVVDERFPVAYLVAPTLVGVVVTAVALRGLSPATPRFPVALLTCAFAVAFVGIWSLTATFVAPVSFGLSVAAEIVLAAGAGAVVLARCSGEPALRVALRWTAAATLAVLAGVVVALALRVVVPDGDGVLAHLDVGTSVGLGLAAALAVLPSLRTVAEPATRRAVPA